MALTTQWDKSKWSLIFERPNRRERGEEEKREEEEEEEKKKRREEEGEKFKQGQKGMELCIDLYGYMFVGCGL